MSIYGYCNLITWVNTNQSLLIILRWVFSHASFLCFYVWDSEMTVCVFVHSLKLSCSHIQVSCRYHQHLEKIQFLSLLSATRVNGNTGWLGWISFDYSRKIALNEVSSWLVWRLNVTHRTWAVEPFRGSLSLTVLHFSAKCYQYRTLYNKTLSNEIKQEKYL